MRFLAKITYTKIYDEFETEEQVEAAIEAEHPFLEGYGLTPEVPMRQTCNCGGPDV